MVKVGTVSAVIGVLAALWNIKNYLYSCGGPLGATYCLVPGDAPSGLEGTVVMALSVTLVVVSLATFLAPPSIFYLSAALALAIDVLELLSSSLIFADTLYITLAIVSLELVLSLVAAVRRTSVSEESHPLNLPVFG